MDRPPPRADETGGADHLNAPGPAATAKRGRAEWDDFRKLPADCKWAVRTAYDGWAAAPHIAASAWQQAHEGGLEETKLAPADKARLAHLAAISNIPSLALQAWHTACSEALRTVPASALGREEAAQMCMDSANILDMGFAAKAFIAAAERIIMLGGRATARLFAAMLHDLCLPNPLDVAEAVKPVPAFCYKHRVYVL